MTALLDRRRVGPARVALLALGVLLVAGYLLGVPFVPQTGFGPAQQYRLDLDVYRLGAQAFLDGTPLYGPEFPVTALGERLPFVYPPIAAVLFVPLTWMSLPVASIVTTAVSGALAVLLLVAYRRRHVDVWWVVGAVPVVLLLDPVRLTLLLGQVNLVLLALVTVDVLAARDRPWRGVLVGVAAAVKLTPLVFVVWLLVERDRRAAVRAGSTFAALTTVGALLAPAESARFWTGQLFGLDALLAPETAGNQNLRAVVVRLGLEAGDARALWLLLAAGVLLAGLAVAIRCRDAGEPLLGMAVLSCCGLLASPISWSHHWVWALPALPLLADLARRHDIRWPWWLAGAGLALFAIGPMWLLPREQGRELAWTWWQQVVGASYPLWGLAVLVVVAVGAIGSSAPRVPLAAARARPAG